MSTRKQKYIISPSSACPSHLLISANLPPAEVPLDIALVAQSACREIIQTAPHSGFLFNFIEELLEPGSDLIWKESGPGRGTEMRRSFSGIFGRFFARAYLSQHHNFTWFCAIDGDNFHIARNWRIKRAPPAKTEMPDWICARPGELAIGEAKGSHQKGNVPKRSLPKPIQTAAGQIQGVVVQKLNTTGRRQRWRPIKVKGWAIMSRWGTAKDPSRPPFLYALDPWTDGEDPSDDEIEELVQAVARTHVKQIAKGLDLLTEQDERTSASRYHEFQISGDPKNRTFLGQILSPWGPISPPGSLRLGLFIRRKIFHRVFPKDAIMFVGLESNIWGKYLSESELTPIKPETLGDGAFLGQDSLVIAPISQIEVPKKSNLI
ncbi:hypothetical protein [Thalassospira xiamenensis]|uniref:Uncharacterized protein n=1 Tax=Thalassospira xiamenensis TaxID=220697 RepID=A0A285RN02_9PROT|nr:hypothetical protein [Thalassospira xiamenensis]SOB93657.1 hypothetical protein SAMN05428964_101805 [Thalassospira xiamenensis]